MCVYVCICVYIYIYSDYTLIVEIAGSRKSNKLSLITMNALAAPAVCSESPR